MVVVLAIEVVLVLLEGIISILLKSCSKSRLYLCLAGQRHQGSDTERTIVSDTGHGVTIWCLNLRLQSIMVLELKQPMSWLLDHAMLVARQHRSFVRAACQSRVCG